MPTYEYRCPNGHAFDVFQKMSDEPGADCPECGAAAERQFSAGAGFLFKGDGFYITDYRSDSYRKAAKAEAGKGGDAGSTGGSASDSKGSAAKSSGSEGGSSSGSASKASSPSSTPSE